jgi:hypothetical protein
MALILFGVYVLIVSRVRISPRRGLKGKGARIAGASYMICGTGFITFIGMFIVDVIRGFGLPFGAAIVCSGVLQLATYFLVPTILMQFYGNAFSGSHHRRSDFHTSSDNAP